MNEPIGTTGALGPPRRWLASALAIAITAAASFASGYHLGVARQEKKLLREFVINAARLGILDYGRLRELAEEAGTNVGIAAEPARGQEDGP